MGGRILMTIHGFRNISLLSQTPKIISNDLALHWDIANSSSYPGSGNTITDLSGNNRSGTIINGYTYSSNNGGYLDLNGTNQYINLAQINASQSTIDFWFFMRAYPSGLPFNFYVLIRQGFNPINFSIYIDNYVIKPNYIGSGSNFINTGQSLSGRIDQWSNLVLCSDWNNNAYSVYLNGLNISSGPMNAGSYVFNNTSQGYNTTDVSRNVNNDNSFLNGRIAAVKIYNKILNSSEIKQNFNALRGRYGI